MARFSDRYGYTSVRDAMQLEGMNEELRNGLWSAFFGAIGQSGKRYERDLIDASSQYYKLLDALWRKFFKLPIDHLPKAVNYGSYSASLSFARDWYYKLSWFEAYNFLEFTAQHVSYGSSEKSQFINGCNEVLRQEIAAYRFVNDEITQITSNEEIAEIEQAINEANTNAVAAHLSRALELLSDKTEPDYRNSIKESISAVEALCANLTGDSSATLGQALKRLDADGAIQTHPALNGAFQKLYGYTSDAGGIRHASLEEDRLDFEDAKFMLVSCSAFVNYLQAKATKSI